MRNVSIIVSIKLLMYPLRQR